MSPTLVVKSRQRIDLRREKICSRARQIVVRKAVAALGDV
jgi:hypothetical protein